MKDVCYGKVAQQLYTKNYMLKFLCAPGSSSGGTDDSDSFNGGSNPSPGNFIFHYKF